MDVLLGVALVLGVMILVHEWGHFIAARIFGVRVDVFSIGFGPRLFGWKRGATDYRLSAIPLGGYVRMAGQDPTDIDSPNREWLGKRGEGKPGATRDAGHAQNPESSWPTSIQPAPDELMANPRWQRAVISFAGPAVNLIFPIILLVGYFVAIGMPYPAWEDKPVQVTAVPKNSASAEAGLQPGDKVISINGQRCATWEQADKIVSELVPNGKASLEVENNGARRTIEVAVQSKDEQLLGFAPVKPVIDDVAPGMPAKRAGLREGDIVRAVDGQPIEWWGQFTERVRGSNGKSLALDVERNGQVVHLVVAPQPAAAERGETVYQIGVQVHEDIAYKRVSFLDGVRDASLWTFERTADTIGVVGRLISGRVSVKQLQSVVGISRAAGQAVHRGPQAVISLMVLISVNLGILNLLPIPILDGGNILLLAIEGGLRRDLSMAFKERFVQVGLVFLLVLFAYVMYNDVVRLLPIHS